jgi:hypothetical protein
VTPTLGHPVATDGWKLELLDTLCLDHYFTAEQARRILGSIDYADSRVVAAARVFTRITDTENWPRALDLLTGIQQHELNGMLGVTAFFSPRNPTGQYTLAVASQTQYMCAMQLLEIYRAQWANGLCRWPRSCCFVEWSADGVQLETQEPHKLSLPCNCSTIQISFVDLAPIPPDLKAMHPSTFSALRSLLLNSPVRTRTRCRSKSVMLSLRSTVVAKHARATTSTRVDGHTVECMQVLDVVSARRTVEDYRTKQAVTVLSHFEGFAADRNSEATDARMHVQDTANFIPFMRTVSILFSITGSQLLRLLRDLPPGPTPDSVDALRCALLRMCTVHRSLVVNVHMQTRSTPATKPHAPSLCLAVRLSGSMSLQAILTPEGV